MAGGSVEGLVRGSSLACAGRGGGRAVGTGGSVDEFGCCTGADGKGGGPVWIGATASCSNATGDGSDGDPGRKGVGGKLRRTPSFVVSGGRVMGRGGGPSADDGDS